jgi:hypothetical protein
MGRTWVLDTETKGTGAEMVPLEKALKEKRHAPTRERASVVRRKRASPPPEAAEPSEAAESRRPPEFKVVSAISGQVLAEGARTRETVDLLRKARSMVDLRVYVRETDADKWRALTLREQKVMRASP